MRNMTVALMALLVVGSVVAGGCGKVSSTVSGSSGRKLTILAPADQTVKQGDTNKVGLAIVRQNFNDAVEVEVSDLPSGVTVAGGSKLTIAAGSLSTDSMTLIADKDAAVITDHRVSVTAKGPDGISVTEFFKLTVKAKS